MVSSNPVVTGTAPPRGIDRIGALSGAPLRRSSGNIANRVATFSEHRGRAFGRSLTGKFPFSVFRSRAGALVTDAKLLIGS